MVIQGESALTSQAQLALASPTAFRQMCGDNFVTQLDAGASVLFRLTLTFDSSVEKNYFDDQLQQIGGLENVLAIIKQNSLPNIHYSLSADGMQVGGNPQLLNNLFLQYGGAINSDGYATLNCGSGTNISANCVNLVNQVVNYAQTLKSQLNSPADYYLSNPVISSYNNIGIYSGAVNPDPAIIQAMESVTSSYSNLVSTNQFIQNYQNALADEGLLSSSLQSDLQQLAILYQNAVAVYLDPANSVMDCYNGFVSDECLNIYANLNFQMGQIFNNPSLLSELNYLRTQQYLVRLPISNDINQTVICSIYPLASATNNNYAVNCDGSVSGSLTALPIQFSENTADYNLTVNNLHYNYNGNNFIVSFPQPLQQSGFYNTGYSGVAQVSINGNLLADNYPLTFVKQAI